MTLETAYFETTPSQQRNLIKTLTTLFNVPAGKCDLTLAGEMITTIQNFLLQVKDDLDI